MGAITIRGGSSVTPTTVGGVTYGMDGTERTLDDLNIDHWSLKFQSLGDDVFEYSVKTQNAKGLGTIVPLDGQQIRVYYDGTRIFSGHVVAPKLGLGSLKVRVYGPWWWMGKIMISGTATDASGTSDDRTSYVFPTQGLRDSFRSLINRAVDMGVPMAKVTSDAEESARMDGMFPMVKTTLSNMSFAAAFAELMSRLPDAVMWFDYEAQPVEMHISRRSNMVPISYAVGSTGNVRVESADIYPRLDQQVARVELKHMTRNATNGLPKFASQTYGTAAAGKVQIVTISGPESVPFLPKDDFDSVKIKTVAATFSTPQYFIFDTVLKSAIETYGAFLGNASGWNVPNWYRVVSTGDLPDWLRTDYGLKKKTFRINGWVTGSLPGGGLGNCASYLKSIGRLAWDVGGTNPQFRLYVDFEFEGVSISYPSTTTVYKKWDYDFLQPPANLAQNLQAAQDWIPWEGPVVIARADLNGYNGIKRTFNLTGSHPDHAAMNALVRSVTFDSRRRVTWDLGAPARIDVGGLVNKMRSDPQSQIVWL